MPPSTPSPDDLPDDVDLPAEPDGKKADAVANKNTGEAPGAPLSDILRTELQALAASLTPPDAPPGR